MSSQQSYLLARFAHQSKRCSGRSHASRAAYIRGMRCVPVRGLILPLFLVSAMRSLRHILPVLSHQSSTHTTRVSQRWVPSCRTCVSSCCLSAYPVNACVKRSLDPISIHCAWNPCFPCALLLFFFLAFVCVISYKHTNVLLHNLAHVPQTPCPNLTYGQRCCSSRKCSDELVLYIRPSLRCLA